MSDHATRKYAIRVEYEYPPTRGILSTWFEEDPKATDDDIMAWFAVNKPKSRIRKIDRNVSVKQNKETP